MIDIIGQFVAPTWKNIAQSKEVLTFNLCQLLFVFFFLNRVWVDVILVSVARISRDL